MLQTLHEKFQKQFFQNLFEKLKKLEFLYSAIKLFDHEEFNNFR